MKNFKPIFIDAATVDFAWFELLSNIYKHGRKYKITSGSYAGHYRYTLDYVAGYIRNVEKDIVPSVPANSGLPEPTNMSDIEEYFANYLLSGTTEKNEHYKYGSFIVGGLVDMPPNNAITMEYYQHYFDKSDKVRVLAIGKRMHVPDMLAWVIDHFKNKGYGNEHCYINIGYPEMNLGYEVPYKNETDRYTTPCLRGVGFKIIEIDGEYYLQIDVTFRSWDAVGGFPTNIGGFCLLNQYVAQHLPGVNPGSIAFASKGLHAYDFHMDYVKARLNKK